MGQRDMELALGRSTHGWLDEMLIHTHYPHLYWKQEGYGLRKERYSENYLVAFGLTHCAVTFDKL